MHAIPNSVSQSEVPATPPTWVRWQIVALLMSYSFMNWLNRVSVSVADGPIMEEFQLSSFQIGLIDSGLLVAYTLCMTPGGWFIDRFGPRMALILMGFGTAVFVALTGLAGHALWGTGMAFFSFLVIRASLGASSAPIYPASAKMVKNWIPASKKAWANGLINGAAPVGIAVAHVVLGYLVREFTWRNALVLTGASTAALALLWTWYVTNKPSEHPRVNAAECQLIEGAIANPGDSRGTPAARRTEATQKADWGLLLSSSTLMLLTLSYAAVGYFEYLFNFCSEHYFKRVLHISEEVSQRYASVASLCMALAMPVGGLVSDFLVHRRGLRFGRAFPPVAGMIGSAGALFAATLTRDEHWTLLWFALANFAIGATEGSFWTTAVDIGGRRGGTTGAIVNTGGNAGGILAPAVSRGLGELFHEDWRPGFYIGSLVCLAGAVLWWWIDPRKHVSSQEADAPSPG
jgi:MFS family permease